MAKTTIILDPALAALAVSSLHKSRADLAELATKFAALKKSIDKVEAALLATVQSRGAFVVDGQYVGLAKESKTKKAVLGYLELIEAVTIVDAEMGETVEALAATALEDKAQYNAANPEINISLVIRPAVAADGVISFSTNEKGQISLSA